MLILLTTLFSSPYLLAQSPSKQCKLNEDIETQDQISKQVLCLKKYCLDQLSTSSDEDQTEDSVSDQHIKSCVEDIYRQHLANDKESRLKEIARLKKKITSSEDLALLLNLAQIEEIEIKGIEQTIIDHFQYWDDAIVYQIYQLGIYDKQSYLNYLMAQDYSNLNNSSALIALLENHAYQEIEDYIISKNKLTAAVFKLKPTVGLAQLILNNTSSKLYNDKYLTYAREKILKDNSLNLFFSDLLYQNINNQKFNSIFLKSFQSHYKNNFWKYYLLADAKITIKHFENIDVSKRIEDIQFIINHLQSKDINLVTDFLDLILTKNKKVFNQVTLSLIEYNSANEEHNEVLLIYIIQNIEKINKVTILYFLENSRINYIHDVNTYNVSNLALEVMNEQKYFEFITDLFTKYNKINLLINASYNVNAQNLKSIIEITREKNVNLFSNINLSMIRNINSWVINTKECVLSNCSNLNDFVKIPSTQIYRIIFKYGNIAQTINLYSLIANESNNIYFNNKDILSFIKILEQRESNFDFVVNNMKKLIEKSEEIVSELLNIQIDEDISKDNLNKRINDLRKNLPLTKNRTDKSKVTKALLNIEYIISQMKADEKGVALEELYNLIELEKMSISEGFVNTVNEKSILSALQNLYRKRHSSKWATDLVLDELQQYGNLVTQIDDENKALYKSYMMKYALATASETRLKALDYFEIDALSKMMMHYNELPKKINLKVEELNYSEILKQFFVSFNNYFNTHTNTQVNIPLLCDSGSTCIYDMRYNQNIGALTNIKSELEVINYNQEDLKVYKNRNINIIGALNDVLYIDGSVDKNSIPDQRKRAQNGIPPKIGKRNRNVTYCVFRVKYPFGSACLKKKTKTLVDEYVAAIGFPPEDGLDGFSGADSAEIYLNLKQSQGSKFSRIIILNNSGVGGEGQLGGIWNNKQFFKGRARSNSSESDLTFAGVGFGFGSAGKGKRVSIDEAIPGYKEQGTDGEKGLDGNIKDVHLIGEAKSFSVLQLGIKLNPDPEPEEEEELSNELTESANSSN